MLNRVSWVFYIVGTALVVGSWVNLVSPTLGWIGFAIGLIGWGMQFLPGYLPDLVSVELKRLSDMHTRGELTDQEFAEAKERVLATK